LKATVGLAEPWVPPVAKETYDQATNPDGPMLPLDDAAAEAAAEDALRPAGAAGSLSPARPAPLPLSPGAGAARETPARAGGAAGSAAPALLSNRAGDDRASSEGDGAALLGARLSKAAAAAVVEDASFRSFVENKSRVVRDAVLSLFLSLYVYAHLYVYHCILLYPPLPHGHAWLCVWVGRS
jgi:hypothetical protein